MLEDIVPGLKGYIPDSPASAPVGRDIDLGRTNSRRMGRTRSTKIPSRVLCVDRVVPVQRHNLRAPSKVDVTEEG